MVLAEKHDGEAPCGFRKSPQLTTHIHQKLITRTLTLSNYRQEFGKALNEAKAFQLHFLTRPSDYDKNAAGPKLRRSEITRRHKA